MGKNCDTAFWSGYYYCVSSTNASPAGGNESTGITTAQPVIETALPLASNTVTTTTCDPSSTPVSGSDSASSSPTQSGVVSSIRSNHTGDTCASFAAANQITPADLYSRNGALGKNGDNCETEFWGGNYYCVGGTD